VKVLVTGVAGPRGRKLATHLLGHGHDVVGVDTDRWSSPPDGLAVHRLDHRKRDFENLVRTGGFDGIVHLAVHAGFRLPPAERHRLNMEGTGKVIQLAVKHGAKKLVVSSHAVVYGALPDNPYFMTEDAPPRLGRSLPQMQDLVTADLLASTAMWKHPELELVVLRPVHTLGPTSRGVFAQLLRRRRVPTVLGFDPMVQVIHEDDLAAAFGLALADGLRGVYNVTGSGALPLSALVEGAGCHAMPLPGGLFHLVRGLFGLPHVVAGAVDFLKHPCLVDGERFRAATGFEPVHSLRATVESVQSSAAAG